MSQSPQDQPLPVVAPKHMAVLIVVAVVVGLIAGLGASLFLKVEHELTSLLWRELPEALGMAQPAPWLVIALLLTGALLVSVAIRLPGHGGHHPLQGLGLDAAANALPSVVLAAMGSLCFGAVLGPEAPLIATGTGLAALAVRRPGQPLQQVMMLVGAMAAVSAIFGNPLITAILLLEVALAAGSAVASAPVLMAALTGMAASYTLQIGIAGWSGLGQAELGLPGLQPYADIEAIDIAASVPLAVIIALLAVGARLAATRVESFAAGHPVPVILAAAVIVGGCAVVVSQITAGPVTWVLFSGQRAIPDYLALTSISTLLVIFAGKLVAYVASLGSGFRGGAVFPAVALGVLLAVMTAQLVAGTSTSALAATAIAAATVGVLRLPFTGLLLGVMLTYPAGGATTVLAVVGTVVAMVTRLAAEQRIPSLVPARNAP